MKAPIKTTNPAINANALILEERVRIAAILESSEGRAHPKTAIEFALRSTMSPSQAIKLMASLPSESPLLDAMAKETIGIGANLAASTELATGGDKKAARLAEIRQATDAVNAINSARAATAMKG